MGTSNSTRTVSEVAASILTDSAPRTPTPLSPHGPRDTRRCTNCGEIVHTRLQDAGWARTEYVFPVDERGWCPSCLWMEGAA